MAIGSSGVNPSRLKPSSPGWRPQARRRKRRATKWAVTTWWSRPFAMSGSAGVCEPWCLVAHRDDQMCEARTNHHEGATALDLRVVGKKGIVQISHQAALVLATASYAEPSRGEKVVLSTCPSENRPTGST